MNSVPVTVFFYGLFMDAEALREKGLHPLNSRQASVAGLCLRIGRRATLVPDPAGRVHGFVIGLSQQELEQLADRSLVPALCFNLPPSQATAEANPEYAAKLRALAGRLGLPADYVASIQ